MTLSNWKVNNQQRRNKFKKINNKSKKVNNKSKKSNKDRFKNNIKSQSKNPLIEKSYIF